MSQVVSSSAIPRMIRGTVMVQRRRCGKPNCRCADGFLHETTVLTYSKAGRSHSVALAATEVTPVRAAVERYRRAQARLEAAGNAGLETLVARRVATRRGR
jgi:hypothetical protein